MKCAESLADGVREREEKIATAAWKKSYFKTVISFNGPPGKLRGVLLALWDMSDPMGRSWHSLDSISRQSNTPKRTVQRYLDELAEGGWITKTQKTWSQLAIEQANLGFPLPGRHDDANAPVLILLTYKGKPAVEEMKLRIATDGHSGHDPRPKRPHGPVANLAHDPGNSVLATNKQDVGDPKHLQPPANSLIDHLEPAEREGWRALLKFYEQHYRRVYQARPTSAIPLQLAKPLGGHVADIAVLLRARLHAKDITIRLEDAIDRIADKAMGAWLESGGSDGKFLRKVAHRLSELQNDLPRRAKQALDTLVAEMTPKPEPRSANVVPFTPRNVIKHSSETPSSMLEQVRVKPVDCTDAPKCEVQAVSLQVLTTGQTTSESVQVKQSSTDAPRNDNTAVSSQVLPSRQTTGKLDQVKRVDGTDATEAYKLMERLRFPTWCDDKMALEMLHAKSIDEVVETVSRLRINEKSMTRPKIYAKIFIALYGPETRNDNRC